MSILMKFSKAGFNVLTTTDPDDLSFSSEYNTLKYETSGTVQLVVSGANAETSVSHGFSYIPVFFTYYNDPVSTSRYSMTPLVFEDVVNYTYIESYADTSKIYFTVHTNSLNATITFYYKIFKNDTNL